MSKLHFFEFVLMLHDHLDEDAFKICYIDTDSVLIASTAVELDEIVKCNKVKTMSFKNQLYIAGIRNSF